MDVEDEIECCDDGDQGDRVSRAEQLRLAALDFAVRAVGSDRTPANVLKAAEMFADFLEGKREFGTGRVRMVSGEVLPRALG